VASVVPISIVPEAKTGSRTADLLEIARLRVRISWRLASLSLLVHADAFRSAPLLYLQGLVWRIRGLRVRSRNRIAALAGRSRRAYELWIVRNEAASKPPVPISGPTIWPIIDCRNDTGSLAKTLESLVGAGAKIEPILIGTDAKVGKRRLQKPCELAKLIADRRPWLLPLVAGDRLAAGSLAIYTNAASHAHRSCLIYADDDLISSGKRHAPHFKPDWNPELLEHHDYVSGSCIVRVDRKGLASLTDEGWAEALTRMALDSGGIPLHIKQVLHHRRSRPEPVIPAKPAQIQLPLPPSVTAIIPTLNGHALLRSCINGLEQAGYPCMETIIVDNGSDEPATLSYLAALEQKGATVLRLPGPFNYSALNNQAVKHAKSELLCFLNNDVEMTDPDWLAMLVQHAVKPDLGAVGARLLYPDGSIQHAGVFTGIGGGAGHAHRFQRADESGYFERARLPQRVSAVTAACMVVAKEKFVAVGGFDEERFPVAFNDVDLCLKLNGRGWQSFYEPRATLVHHESKSRGSDRSKDKRARFAGELASLKRVWNTDKIRDPYHHPNLSAFCEEFLVAL
jgi:GT2 family glycosyltransferase